MIRLALALAIAAVATPLPVLAKAAQEAPLTERNRKIMTDFADIFYRQKNPRAAYMKYVVPDYVQHNPRLGDGRDVAIAFLEKLFANPGARFEVKRMLVDGELAVVHIHGRADPSTPGNAAIDIFRLKDGMIVEHWDAVQPITLSAVNPHPFF